MDDKKVKKTAGALDVRNIIGALIGGVRRDPRRAGDLQRLHRGEDRRRQRQPVRRPGLLVVAAAFLVWARLRPLVVPKDVEAETNDLGQTTTPRGRRRTDRVGLQVEEGSRTC